MHFETTSQNKETPKLHTYTRFASSNPSSIDTMRLLFLVPLMATTPSSIAFVSWKPSAVSNHHIVRKSTSELLYQHEDSTMNATSVTLQNQDAKKFIRHRKDNYKSNGFKVSRSSKRLTEKTMCQTLRKMQYAVRGEVVIAADRINKEIKIDPHSHPAYDHVVYTNIGNPHGVGQHSLTWPRQVMALCNLPDELGIDHPDAEKLFPRGAIERAKEIKHIAIGDVGTGAYSHSQGYQAFRDHIANFIEQRDGGIPAKAEDIFMTNGASKAIDMVLQTLLADETCGTMIPIPQYPLYSATIALRGAHQVNYYLDEENGWSLDIDHLEQVLANAQARAINVNSFVLINPGNPTGQVLSREAVRNVVKFCAKHNLVLLSDEVYQDNVYDDNAEFVSCKQAAFETGLLQQDALELISFHSTSKGLYGECGHRGGYMEIVGMDKSVEDHIYKLASSVLCPNLDGQIMMDLMVRGPEPSDESYQTHENQKKEVFESLKRRAKLVVDGLNSIPGFSCQPAQGAMYCFPSIEMPHGAIVEARKRGTDPDTMYALSLLEETGICVVPASGFGQEPGRHGFRTTFLPPENEMERAVQLFKKHHEIFCRKYE